MTTTAAIDQGTARRSGVALVGRAGELAQLTEVLERAVRFRAPQLVTIVGGPGIGKTRLWREWVAQLDAGPVAPVRVLRAAATAKSGPDALFRRILRERFEVTEGEDKELLAAKVRAQLEEVFGDRRLAEVMHFIGRFLGFTTRESPLLRALADDPRHHERIGRTVLRRVFEIDAERTPLVIAIDDLHHADDDSLDLLSEMAATLEGSPVVLLAVARPELLVRHPRWGADTDHTRIDLGPLPRGDAEALLRKLLSEKLPIVPPALVAEAWESTAGNPFLVEELARVVLADGILQGGVVDLAHLKRVGPPVTVEQAVAARIAALGPGERDLLEKAATFGNVFWTGALVTMRRLDAGSSPGPFLAREARGLPREDRGRALDDVDRREAERVLADLVERDYLLRMPDSTIADEAEYVFKHNLECELVTRMTAPERAKRHARCAAQWLETRIGGRTDDQLEFLAQLYERAGDRARAAHAWFSAGDAARARFASAAARDYYQRGLALVDADDTMGRIDALHSLGVVTALGGATREALACFEEMLRAAWLLDLPAKAGAAHGRIGRCHRTLGDFDAAEHHLGEALALFARAGDERGTAAAEDDLGRIACLRGAHALAESRHRRALEIRQRLGDKRSIALTVHNLALVAHAAGRYTEAVAHLEQALGLRRQTGDRAGVAQSLLELGTVWRERGDGQRAMATYEEALALAREIGDRALEALALVRMGRALAKSWRYDEATDVLSQADAIATELGDRALGAEAACLHGEALLEQERWDAARPHCRRALELAEEVASQGGGAVMRGQAHRVWAIALGHGSEEERGEADEHFRTAVDLFGSVGADGEMALAYRAYGAFLASIGDDDGAATVRERADEIQRRLDETAAPALPWGN